MNIKKEVLRLLQNRINKRNRHRLVQKSRTIISNNCIGGLISHYLGIRFQSPTVNLFIKPKDYIKMLTEFDKYFDPSVEIIKVDWDGAYPVGRIYDCEVYFMHYKSFEEAVSKWHERCLRIDKNSLYIMMTDRDGCTVDDMKAFDALPYTNKVIFTNQKHEEIDSSYYIRGFEKEKSLGNIQESMNIFGKRYVDQFDYVSFLNRE